MGRQTSRRIIEYFERLIKSDSRESSKRFIALFVTFLIGVIVLFYTNKENMILVLGELIVFVTSLLYIATNGKIPKVLKDNKNQEDE